MVTFFSPPRSQTKALSELCTDPPGFDRATFHKAFDASVLAFFRQKLVARSKPQRRRSQDGKGG
jgi:hypothetical protein